MSRAPRAWGEQDVDLTHVVVDVAMVGEIAVPLLAAQLAELRVDPRRPTSRQGWVFRGFTALPLTRGAAAA